MKVRTLEARLGSGAKSGARDGPIVGLCAARAWRIRDRDGKMLSADGFGAAKPGELTTDPHSAERRGDRGDPVCGHESEHGGSEEPEEHFLYAE